MKIVTGLFVCCFISFSLLAQKGDSKEYTKMKEALNEKIFGSNDPYFKSNTVPDQYKNESAVILAQKHSLESDSRIKVRFSFMIARGGAQYSLFETFREKILINDKSSLEEYSQLSFSKLQSKTKGYLGKLKNYTFINIRLIKPNGTIKTIDVDESTVTVKEEGDEKKNKIAIPDLTVGDIIDYYIVNYFQEEGGLGKKTPMMFVLGDDYPVLNYILSLQFDSRMAVEYQCINGAPDFKISPDEDGDGNVLNMVVKNVPKLKGLVWSSYFRQIPVVRLNYANGPINRIGMAPVRQGNAEKATKSYTHVTVGGLAALFDQISSSESLSTGLYEEDRKKIRAAWKKYIAKYPRADQPDSIPPFVFRYIKWLYSWNNFDLQTNYNNAYFPFNLKTQLYFISKLTNVLMLEFRVTDLEFVLLTGKNSYRFEDLFDESDLTVLVRTPGPRPQYFSFTDNLDYSNSIPPSVEGEKAQAIPLELKKQFRLRWAHADPDLTTSVTLPSSGYKDNYESETISAIPDESDLQLMHIKRRVSSTGHMKKDAQASLTIFEEMALQTGATVGEQDDIIAQNNNRGKKAKKETEELQTLLEKARTKHKVDFENEINRTYDAKAKELKKFHIHNFGLDAKAPFEFEEEFVMEGWVKKAGNNYIVDLGKFVAGQIEIQKDQRERSLDVYMPFPRGFSYHIELTIPNGYAPEGMDKLNSATENETGAFVSKAKLEGNKLVVDISKYYNHSFETAAKWPLLLKFLDMALEFNQQKILLKKL